MWPRADPESMKYESFFLAKSDTAQMMYENMQEK